MGDEMPRLYCGPRQLAARGLHLVVSLGESDIQARYVGYAGEGSDYDTFREMLHRRPEPQ
jgi:hypothetical protein